MTLERFLELMQELEPHDVSVAVAVLELIRGADDSGSVNRDDWVSSVRHQYEELELHLKASWRERGGEVGGYLEEQVIGRLEAVGIAGRDAREDGWERLVLDDELWQEMAVDREPLVENIEARRWCCSTSSASWPASPRTTAPRHPPAGWSRPG